MNEPVATPRRPGAAHPPSLAVRTLRTLRPVHRWIGVPLTLFLILSGLTGAILGWKKNVDLLQPPTPQGVSDDLRSWRPVHEVERAARAAIAARLGIAGADTLALDRIDIRPDKGIAKVRFVRGDWEVQVDGTSAEVLSVARRHADWIERIHDGSIIGDLFKVAAMSTLGVALVALSATGLWIWLGPLLLRRRRQP